MFGNDILIVGSIFTSFVLIFIFDKSLLKSIIDLNWYFYAYFVLSLISTFSNIAFGNDNYFSGLIFLTSFYLVIVMGYHVFKNGAFKKIIKFHTLFLGISVIFGFIEYITKENILLPLFFVDNLTGTGRICSFFVHPLIFSFFIIVFYWLLILNPKINILLKALFIILSVVCLYATMSRSSWIAFFVSNVLYFLRLLFLKRISVSKFILGLSVMVVSFGIMHLVGFIDLFVDGLTNRISNIEESISYLQRTRSWAFLIDDYWNNSNFIQLVFGRGFKGSFWTLTNNTIVIPGFFTTDNSFVSVFYNYGLLTSLIVLMLVIGSLIFLFKTKNKLLAALSISLISLLIVCFFFEIDFFLNIAFFFYLYLGILFGNKKIARRYSL